MITFKTITDLSKLPRDDPARAVILDLLHQFPRDPESQGYIVLIQPGDTDIDLPELKGTIADLCFDGVAKQDGYYLAVYLTSNEWALELAVPDADWLSADIRASLESQSENWPSYMKDPPF